MTTPRKRRTMLITVDLSQATGPVLTTGQLGRALGFSDEFIRSEIKAGEIQASCRRKGKRSYYRIAWTEVRRYARQMGAVK